MSEKLRNTVDFVEILLNCSFHIGIVRHRCQSIRSVLLSASGGAMELDYLVFCLKAYICLIQITKQ